MDGKIIAILAQNKAEEVHMAALGDAGVESAAIFGHVARTEEASEVPQDHFEL